MRKRPTKTHFIPIIDCSCGKKDMPLSHRGTFTKPGLPDIEVWACPACDRVPLSEARIKGYASIAELKAMGWSEEVIANAESDAAGD